jgi:hypothetical protein
VPSNRQYIFNEMARSVDEGCSEQAIILAQADKHTLCSELSIPLRDFRILEHNVSLPLSFSALPGPTEVFSGGWQGHWAVMLDISFPLGLSPVIYP